MKKNITLLSAVSDIRLLPKRVSKNYSSQLETMKSVRKLDDHIMLLNVKHDYALDDLLEEGAGSIVEIIDFARRRMFYGAKNMKLAEPEMGCSFFNAYNENGEHLMGRNFDYKDAPCMMVFTAPEKGYKSVAVADCNFMLYGKSNLPEKTSQALQTLLAPYICVDGMNEKGLAICVLELKATPTKQETGKKAISTTVMIRNVLDNAATIDEAIALFREYDMHAAAGVDYHFGLTDAEGRSVLIEYVNNEMRLYYPEKHTEDGLPFISVTNFYIAPDGPRVSRGAGFDRKKVLDEALTEKGAKLSEKEALDLLSRVQLHYNHKLGWPVRTLWSAVYNSNALTVDIAAGTDYVNTHKVTVDGEVIF